MSLEDMEAAYVARMERNKTLTRVDNETLPAGSLMYYYCHSCGGEMTRPETHAGSAPYQCLLCEDFARVKACM